MKDVIGPMALRCRETPLRVGGNRPLQVLVKKWEGSALNEETTLHQIAPYIGKMKSSMARTLISTFTQKGEILYDPFCGSGTVPLEAWAAGRNIIANDLNPYAALLTKAKLNPCLTVEKGFADINRVAKQVPYLVQEIDLRRVPQWVRSFFHPETLRETIAWFQVLKSERLYFLLSCLLGILHHQRPGFLSYPSSHTVPYLRNANFPRSLYPELYDKRKVRERLERKVMRALKRAPNLDFSINRECYEHDAAKFVPERKVNAIITSPPYMRQLDYGRDNRLRLWFLGIKDWRLLDHIISPSKTDFLELFRNCLKLWRNILIPKGLCVLVLGDTYTQEYKMLLPDAASYIANKEVGGYSVICKHSEAIPDDRRVRRGCRGNLTETVLVLRNEKG
jgi:methylase of polypeptide subunit release factors